MNTKRAYEANLEFGRRSAQVAGRQTGASALHGLTLSSAKLWRSTGRKSEADTPCAAGTDLRRRSVRGRRRSRAALRIRRHRRDGERAGSRTSAPASRVLPNAARRNRRCALTGRDTLILPGFIDSHVHYPQTQIIGVDGEQLHRLAQQVHLRRRAGFSPPADARARGREGFPATNACAPAPPPRPCICTVHPQSVEAFFEEAARAQHAHDRRQGAHGPQCAGGAHRHGAAGLRRIEGADRANGMAAAGSCTP